MKRMILLNGKISYLIALQQLKIQKRAKECNLTYAIDRITNIYIKQNNKYL